MYAPLCLLLHCRSSSPAPLNSAGSGRNFDGTPPPSFPSVGNKLCDPVTVAANSSNRVSHEAPSGAVSSPPFGGSFVSLSLAAGPPDPGLSPPSAFTALTTQAVCQGHPLGSSCDGDCINSSENPLWIKLWYSRGRPRLCSGCPLFLNRHSRVFLRRCILTSACVRNPLALWMGRVLPLRTRSVLHS